MDAELQYEIGYSIGSYLPVIIILGIALIVWRSAKRKQKDQENQ